MKGRFIALEGIDSDVLVEQASRMGTWLRAEGLTAVVTREPTDGPIGAQIRLVLDGRLQVDELTLAALFLADRMDHLYRERDGILADLERGRYVVCVRYLLSAYAYQSDVASLEWLRQINQFCRWPDLMIYIDSPVESSLRMLVAQEGYDAEQLELHRARLMVEQANYQQVIEICRSSSEDVVVVDGNQPAEAIHRACRAWVERLGIER